MKFLIDENVGFEVVKSLRAENHNVISMTEESFSGIDDDSVFKLALSEKRIIITRDFHFTNLIKFPASLTEGIIYIRHGNLKSTEEKELIMQFINSIKAEEIQGKLVTLYRSGYRIK